MKIEFMLNRKPTKVEVPESTSLLNLLREQLGLTGTKCGCDTGDCGVCAILFDGKLVNSCLIPVSRLAGHQIVTIEGLQSPDGSLSDLQELFLHRGAVQCGFCIPSMILAGEALLLENPNPTRDEVRAGISSVLCRCTGYQQAVDAIEETALYKKCETKKSVKEIYGERPMTELKYVGKHSRSEDGLEKVTGKARYVGDYYLPEMLHAKVLRSPLPHARIVKLDASPALMVPGVLAVITADDFVNHSNLGWPIKDAYALAWSKVRHVGDPVAAVAAESEESAWAGIQAIQVKYEALPVVGDIHHALDLDAPIIPDTKEPSTGNLTNSHLVRFGDPDPILENSDVVLEETYFFKHQEHAYLETEGALAIPEPDGGLTVYANDQSPFINRDNLVMLLGLPTEKVRVIQAYVGGSFGGKDDIGYQTSAQAGALALKTQRPVRLVLTRTESFLASYRREAMEVKIKLGASKDGELKAAKVNLLVDSGGYASMTPLSSWRASVHAAGAYRYQAVHVDTKSVYTNNGYSGAMRGFGNTQGIGGIEQAMDELAYRLNMDPIDFRLKNCLTTGDIAMTGNTVNQTVHLAECLRMVRERSGWDRKRAEYASSQKGNLQRGIGVACYFHGSSLGGEGADYATTTLKIEDDDSITLTSGLTDYGQGSRTVFMLIAAEELGVDVERIRIMRPDTQTGIEFWTHGCIAFNDGWWECHTRRRAATQSGSLLGGCQSLEVPAESNHSSGRTLLFTR